MIRRASVFVLALCACTLTASANFLNNRFKAHNNRSLLSNFRPMPRDHRMAPEVSSARPGYLYLLLDSSESMSSQYAPKPAGHDEISTRYVEYESRAEVAARYTNEFLRSLISRLTVLDESTHLVKPYFDISIRSYSSRARRTPEGYPVSASLLDFLGPYDWYSISELARMARNGLVEKLEAPPFWAELVPNNQTATKEAMAESLPIIRTWAKEHPESHPPIVAHLTDGQHTTGDPSATMQEIQKISTHHGNTIVFNTYLSTGGSEPVLFPSSWNGNGNGNGNEDDSYSTELFNNSSVIPPWWIEPLRNLGFDVTPSSRAFIYNGSIEDFHNVIEMGTRAAMGDSGGPR